VGWFELNQVIKATNVDWRSLGRWCSVVVWISPTHKVRIVVAYSVGKSKPEGLLTVYQQTLTYIREHDLDTNPCRLFKVDFRAALRV